MKSIETDIVIGGIRSRIDGSLGFNASTPELSSEEKVAFMSLQGVALKMLVVPIDEPNAPTVTVEKDLNQKPASQRLRAVLYVLWEQQGNKGTFEDFYKMQMEKFISAVKDKFELPFERK